MYKMFVIAIMTISILNGCKKKTEETTEEAIEDAVSNISETAVSELNSQTNGIVTAREILNEEFQEMIENMAESEDRATCSFSTARSACESTISTITWDGCTIGSSTATLTGVITEDFESFGAAVCQLNGNGSSVSRKISSSNPRTITFASGAKIVTDMEPDNAWDGTTFASATSGTVITKAESGTVSTFTCSTGSSACYTTVINGLQTVMTGPKGRKWFDHIIQGTLYSQGRKSSNNLIVKGDLNIWHQVSQYKAVNNFDNVTWGDSTCCYPTSGTITSTLTGGVTGTATTAFSSTCGTATFVDQNNTSTTVTLKNCSL